MHHLSSSSVPGPLAILLPTSTLGSKPAGGRQLLTPGNAMLRETRNPGPPISTEPGTRSKHRCCSAEPGNWAHIRKKVGFIFCSAFRPEAFAALCGAERFCVPIFLAGAAIWVCNLGAPA